MDFEQKNSNNGENLTANAEKKINEFFYGEEREEDDNLNELVNNGLSSIYMEKSEDEK
ncbi:hypothetical protein [Bacillus sp. NEB1478]|uniref:hypothetical protein n=1 Tax=Bacillus sp. NEB1478 TaxID=3073816 RepID=UPI002872BA05|nr:hypothetical protein [Bacillus sp. NEB1478]WNB91641.1 hypothetical protein RGB74_17460 [Bacillus sp. NEB1478]